MAFFGHRVKDTTTTTGTGTITLSGTPPTDFVAFNDADNGMGVGNTFDYAIVGRGTNEWEVVQGTLATGTTLTRDNVIGSTNAGGLVNFSAGIKDVFPTVSLQFLQPFTENLVISSGQVTPTYTGVTKILSVDTEGSAAIDDLETIGTNLLLPGQIVSIKSAFNGRTVVVRSGLGNINLRRENDTCVLSDTALSLVLGRIGNSFYEISRYPNNDYGRIVSSNLFMP